VPSHAVVPVIQLVAVDLNLITPDDEARNRCACAGGRDARMCVCVWWAARAPCRNKPGCHLPPPLCCCARLHPSTQAAARARGAQARGSSPLGCCAAGSRRCAAPRPTATRQVMQARSMWAVRCCHMSRHGRSAAAARQKPRCCLSL
jgi:hypothetical protein